jgi:hypothetical protein
MFSVRLIAYLFSITEESRGWITLYKEVERRDGVSVDIIRVFDETDTYLS